MAFINTSDTVLATNGKVFCTIGKKRYEMMNVTDAKATTSIKTVDVPRLGCLVTGKRAVGMTIKIDMTVYKISDMFDKLIQDFKDTGVLPTFTIQLNSNSQNLGTDSKIYNECVIDGDLLLSMVGTNEEVITQQITAYANDFSSASGFNTPASMEA